MKSVQLKDNQIMDFTISDDKTIRDHVHQHLELLYILEGEAEVVVNGVTFLLHEEDFIVFNPNEMYSLTMLKTGLAGHLVINYHMVNQYTDLYEHEIHCNSVLINSEKNEDIKKVLRGIVNNYYNKDDKEIIQLNAYYYQLLYLLCTEYLFKKKSIVRIRGNEDENRLQKIMSYINNNYYNSIALEELAQETYFSTAYLSKYIKKKTGKNFMTVLTDVRLKHALEDLMYSNKKFIKVALDNGFPSTAAFNKAFKRAYEITPSEYKQRMLQSKIRDEEKEENNDLSLKIKDFLAGQISDHSVQDENIYSIETDVANVKLYKKNWCLMINGGLAKDLLRGDMQKHILLLKEELNFLYVRFWDIYAPEMLLHNRAEDKKYSFSKLNAILDFLEENGLKPYIELGFKPLRLLKNIDLFMLSEERENIFTDQHEYKDFLNQLLKHCVNRYGMNEVETWYFEQWRDPGLESHDEYFDTFETAYITIKSFSSNIRVGGAGLNRGEGPGLENIIQHWKRRNYYPDFISIYSYPYDKEDCKGAIKRLDGYNSHCSRDKNYMRNYIEQARKILYENGFRDQELHISEWNFTVSNRNCLNDSAFKGAYIVKNLIDTVGKVDLVGYWHSSDLFSEYYDTNFLLDGSGGLLSKDGIRKPAFYGISFMNRLGDYLLGKGENSIVTSNLQDTYSIACHNYEHLGYKYYAKEENKVLIEDQASFFEGKNITFRFRIKGVKNGTYLIKIRSMNDENGSVQDEWRRMGLTENLSSHDIAYLKQISIPRISIRTMEGVDNILDIETTLKTSEIQHIHIIYQMQ